MTFKTQFGTYALTCMPFGLSNAPSTYQRATNSILLTPKFQFDFVYLDDIIVYSPRYDVDQKRVTKVLKLLRGAGVTLPLTHSKFLHEDVKRLRHFIKSIALEGAPDMIEAVSNVKSTVSVREIQSFFGTLRRLPAFHQQAFTYRSAPNRNVTQRPTVEAHNTRR